MRIASSVSSRILPIDLSTLQTEIRNPCTTRIDTLSTSEICKVINQEDAGVASCVETCLPSIANVIDVLAPRVQKGGRLLYIGAGTSGRLGILDASEIPPTFSAPQSQFVALIAGGDSAIRSAQEGAEDSMETAVLDLKAFSLNPRLDAVLGIAASGRTPYVLGGLAYAKKIGCLTIGLTCVSPSAMEISGNLDYAICPVTGPEIVTGSTRLKAGTATKMVLNMLTTGVMIKIGKTYGNLMVDLKVSNLKLRERSHRIIRTICGSNFYIADPEGVVSLTPVTIGHDPIGNVQIDNLLETCGGSVKLALVVAKTGWPVAKARRKLQSVGGVLVDILENYKREMANGSNNGVHLVNGKSTGILDANEQSLNEKKGLGLATNGELSGTIVCAQGNSKLVLCIDGGGSKCAAVIANKEGILSKGEAGSCNFSSVGLEAMLAAVTLATQLALENLPANVRPTETFLRSSSFASGLFAAVWAGFAGVDRPVNYEIVGPALSKLFNISPGNERLRITNDGNLLSSPIGLRIGSNSGVVLIAGTGSVAMSFRRDGKKMVQVARSKGWGHILADEGSGYDIGRRGIRATLTAIDKKKMLENRGKAMDLSKMHLKIAEYFDANPPEELLAKVLEEPKSDSLSMTVLESERVVRIADVTKIVFEAGFSDADSEAQEILRKSSTDLVGTLMLLIDEKVVNGTDSTLVLGGALLRLAEYRSLVLDCLLKQGIHFKYIEVIEDAAVSGAELLAIDFL